MNLKKRKTNAVSSVLIIISILSGNLLYQGQDIISSDDVSGGSGVFVFRQSKTKPQLRASSNSQSLKDVVGRAITLRRQARIKAKVNAAGKTTALKNQAALIKKRRTKRANALAARNRLSISLTAKADMLLKDKSTDQAILSYQEALKANPQNVNAKSGLGKAYAAKGDEIFEKNTGAENKSFDEAISNYEKALNFNPTLSEVFIRLADLNYQKGDIAKAEENLAKAEKNTGVDAETELLRGLIFLKRNDNTAALAAFTRSITLDPKNAEAYFYQAETYDRLNLNDEAISSYRKTLEIDPAFTEAWFDLAVLNYNKGDYREAVSLYKQAITLDKNYAPAHANIASAYRQLERYAEANAEYKIAAEYIKEDADLFSEWGFCLGKVSEWDKAVARLQTARELSPNAIDYANLGWAYLNAAQQDLAGQNKAGAGIKLQQAKEALQKSVELNPRFDAAFLNLGATYAKLGDYQNAISALNKANSLRPKWTVGINELGLAYRSFDKYSDAINQFQKAIDLDNKYAPAYFNLGEAQYKSGKKKDAKKTLEYLRGLNSDLAAKLEIVMKSY